MHQNHNKYLRLNVLLWEARECVGRHDDIKIRAFLETALHVLDGRHHEPCPESRSFTFVDAERIMLAGGECEFTFGFVWSKARIRDGNSECWYGGEWRRDTRCWMNAEWRPRSAPAQYTWEQAEEGMRRGEKWECKHPADERWYLARFRCGKFEYLGPSLVGDNTWYEFIPGAQRGLDKICTWRPYNPGAK